MNRKTRLFLAFISISIALVNCSEVTQRGIAPPPEQRQFDVWFEDWENDSKKKKKEKIVAYIKQSQNTNQRIRQKDFQFLVGKMKIDSNFRKNAIGSLMKVVQNDQDETIRIFVVRELGSLLNDQQVFDALLQELKYNPSLKIRMEISFILGASRDYCAVQPLIDAGRSNNHNVAFDVSLSLNQVTGKNFKERWKEWQEWWNVNKNLCQRSL